jgi:hypothetical protein
LTWIRIIDYTFIDFGLATTILQDGFVESALWTSGFMSPAVEEEFTKVMNNDQ